MIDSNIVQMNKAIRYEPISLITFSRKINRIIVCFVIPEKKKLNVLV